MSKLAIDGGTPVRTDPWPARLQIDDREINAVMELMQATKAGGAFDRYGGVHVDEYEVKFAEAVGTRWATGMSAGTAAVHSALGALRLEPGTEVISSPITDQGAVMPVVAQGCIPVFADASPECMNMSPEGIRAKLTDRTGAIICGVRDRGLRAGPWRDLRRQGRRLNRPPRRLLADERQAHGRRWPGRHGHH